jgi:hypothetical protein
VNNRTRTSDHPSIWLLVGLLIAAALVFRLFWLVADWFVPPHDVGQAPTASDKIAAASALFSAFAFVGLIYTILLQRHELRSQSEDQETLREQVTRQAFEGTFFQLLRLHNDNVRTQTAQVEPFGEVVSGRRAFVVAAAELEGRIANYLRSRSDGPLDLEEINHIYSAVCEAGPNEFGHYFRNLYHIVKYVDGAALSDGARYTAQIRAQLSQAEFVLLLANGLRRAGASKFKPYIEKYALLHEMRVSKHLQPLADQYRRVAFGVREAAV